MRTEALALVAALLMLALSACTPYRVEPAVGTRLRYEFCGSALPSNVHVFIRNAPCPDLAKVQLRAEYIERAFGVSLSGVKVYVTGAAVGCDDVEAFGCQAGDDLTISSSVYVYGLIQHEMAHAAVDRRFGGDLEQWLIDHPEERVPSWQRRREDNP